MGRYKAFRELKENERENKDYIIRFRTGHSGITIMAPHGGDIEPGTSEIAGHIKIAKNIFITT